MSTRSAIAMTRKDGTVAGIYGHSDGYPEGVGRTLLEHYRDPHKLEELIARGAVSSLAADIGQKHSFAQRPDGWTTFYGRDRGEADAAPTIASDVEGFCSQLRLSGCEYFYLFDLEWSVSKPYGRWRALADVLARGVELLVEPDPDRGPDMQGARAGFSSTWFVWPTSKMGRQWIREVEGNVDGFFCPELEADGLELDDEKLVEFLECMRRDGLIAERLEDGL